MVLFTKKRSHLFTQGTYGILLSLLVIVSCQKGTTIVPDDSPTVTNVPATTSVISTKEPNLPATLYDYVAALPDYLTTVAIRQVDNTPANNPLTNEGATLGRVLFYDKNLSVNNTIACASCHRQAAAFSDTAAFSTGFAGGKTGRNSMSLLNARFYQNGHFFWDERAQSAEQQASMPMVHPVEMGMSDMRSVVTKLNQIAYYPNLFQKAFGTSTIDSARTVRAIAQFIRSMVSYRTKYDAGRVNFATSQDISSIDFPNFTAQENLGKQIFFVRGDCDNCHRPETFSLAGSRNNGLDLVSKDEGVGGITKNSSENGLFKVPSLRGVAQSAPYMHDGRFKTLAEVIEHYNSGVKAHPNLSREMFGGGNIRRLNLTQAEKNALVAFLETLTDTGIAKDPKFADPFQQ